MSTLVGSSTEEESGPGSAGELVPQAHVFRLVECGQPRAPSSRHALRGVDQVIFGRGPASAERVLADGQRCLRVLLPDGRVSTEHARLRRVVGRWVIEDLGSKNGTLVAGEAVRTAALSDGDLFELGRTFFLFREGLPTGREDPDDAVADQGALPGLATFHPPLAHALAAVAAIASSTVSIVIHGETGTGKELVARAVHALSGRRGPFVAVNCGAIPENLIESELFGVRRGAYSDAREDRPGIVRSAHEGTLFLDEIGDLRRPLQAAFLRVLQEREVIPVGQARAIPVDIRVVTASHRDLEKLAATGAFREDLVERLSGFNVRLPPVRARREDLGILIASLIGRLAPRPDQVTFHPDAMRVLLRHSWPRNVRELEKRLGTALALAAGTPIQLAHLGDLPRRLVTEGPAPADRDAEEEALRGLLVKLLTEHTGNLSAVARALGKDRVQVRRWLRRLGLDPLTYRG